MAGRFEMSKVDVALLFKDVGPLKSLRADALSEVSEPEDECVLPSIPVPSELKPFEGRESTSIERSPPSRKPISCLTQLDRKI